VSPCRARVIPTYETVALVMEKGVTSDRGKVILVMEKNRVYTLSILSGRGL